MTKALQFKHLRPGVTVAKSDAIEERHKAEMAALREELRIANELVDQFAVLAGLAKFENEDLRHQLSEAQGIINTYSVELGKLNKEHDAMRLHCETINDQLKAAQDEMARLRGIGDLVEE